MSDETPKNYYFRNRARILKKMNAKYQNNPEYREATKQRAKNRYHEDEEYKLATIERAKARYRRIKIEKNENSEEKLV